MATKIKYTLRKYEGDNLYSWAVFKSDDLPKGHRGIVFYGQARPVVSGRSRNQAYNIKRSLESK